MTNKSYDFIVIKQGGKILPKNTFFNLHSDKRERIIEAALDEFSKHSYTKSSINRIVDKSNIAKGSFYQYFDNKKDLFKYILNIGVEKKLNYMKDFQNNLDDISIFGILKEINIAGLKFAKDNPRLSKISNELLKDSNTELRKEVYGENAYRSNEFFEGLLKKGIKKGEIKEDLNIKFISYLLTTMMSSVGEYFKPNISEMSEKEILEPLNQMIDLIENGIKKREG